MRLANASGATETKVPREPVRIANGRLPQDPSLVAVPLYIVLWSSSACPDSAAGCKKAVLYFYGSSHRHNDRRGFISF
jgi:acetyl esterase/lipase